MYFRSGAWLHLRFFEASGEPSLQPIGVGRRVHSETHAEIDNNRKYDHVQVGENDVAPNCAVPLSSWVPNLTRTRGLRGLPWRARSLEKPKEEEK